MTTEARKKANARYDAAHTRQIKMKLNLSTDADIIAKLEDVDNIQGYIKALIREDMKKNPRT